MISIFFGYENPELIESTKSLFKKKSLENEINDEIKAVEKEINDLKNRAPDKINKIAGAKVNNFLIILIFESTVI